MPLKLMKYSKLQWRQNVSAVVHTVALCQRFAILHFTSNRIYTTMAPFIYICVSTLHGRWWCSKRENKTIEESGPSTQIAFSSTRIHFKVFNQNTFNSRFYKQHQSQVACISIFTLFISFALPFLEWRAYLNFAFALNADDLASNQKLKRERERKERKRIKLTNLWYIYHRCCLVI